MTERLPDDVVERLGAWVGQEERKPGARPALTRYDLGELIGEGAAGSVYRARDRELNRDVAVKLLKSTAGSATELRFQREAQVAARLSHPNVVPVYDLGEEGGHIYLVMELIEGTSLQQVIRDRPIAAEQAAALMEKIARGVAAAHDQGVIHRDLKPANILITREGEPKVADFGVAHLAESDVQLTRTGAVLGTPLYMSPEQVSGAGLKPSADVHALGAILYEMLVRRPPHTGQTVTELYGKIVNDDPLPPGQIGPVPRDLETITLKALEKSPDRRYPTAREFADDLRRFLDREPVLARPAGAVDRVLRWGRRRRSLVTGVAVASAALAAGALLFSAQQREQRRRSEWTAALDRARGDVDRLERLQDNGAVDDAIILGRFDAVRDQVRDLLGRADLAPGRLLLGRILDLSGRDDLARDEWRRAIGIDPGFAPAHYELGHSLMVRVILDIFSRSENQRRRFRAEAEELAREASRYLERAVGSGLESELQGLLARAILLHARGDSDAVKAIAGAAVKKFPAERGIEEMHLLLGLASTPPEERIAAFTAALALRPRYAAARFARGLANMVRDPAKALEDFNAAIRFDPRCAAAYANRAVVRGDHGNFAAVMDDCDRAIALDARCGQAWCNRALVKQRLGMLDDALADCERALAIDPDDPSAHSARAGILAQKGDAEGALKACDRALAIAPEMPGPYGTRAGIWNEKGDYARGEADATRALELEPGTVSAWINRGFARLMLGRPREAVADYDEAIKRDTRMPVAYLGRGWARKRAGDLAGAKADADRALETAPPGWPARRSVQQLLDELGRF